MAGNVGCANTTGFAVAPGAGDGETQGASENLKYGLGLGQAGWAAAFIRAPAMPTTPATAIAAATWITAF